MFADLFERMRIRKEVFCQKFFVNFSQTFYQIWDLGSPIFVGIKMKLDTGSKTIFFLKWV